MAEGLGRGQILVPSNVDIEMNEGNPNSSNGDQAMLMTANQVDMSDIPGNSTWRQTQHGSTPPEYLETLLKERDSLMTQCGPGLELTKKLLQQEIERLSSGGRGGPRGEDRRMSDVTKDKSIKLTTRVLVPTRDHPKFNFVGKLLGPKGNSLKRLQEETMTKMAILGKGSMRDKQKEEELRGSGDPKVAHLLEDLHVEVTAVAPPAEAHARIAYALTEIRRYLVPDYNDDIRQEQMREMQILNSSGNPSAAVAAAAALVASASGNSPGSDGDCSPHSAGTPPPSSAVLQQRTGVKQTAPKSGTTANSAASHPALRGLSHNQTTMLASGGGVSRRGGASGGGVGNGGNAPSGSGARRSVLSLLTRARAVQQKEQDPLFSVFADLSSFGIYDQLTELQTHVNGNGEGNTGLHRTGALKPGAERGRFRHDPYQRVPASS